MVCIRQATVEDLLQMQRCNLLCLPENYQLKVRRGSSSYCRGTLRMWTPAAAVMPRRGRSAM